MTPSSFLKDTSMLTKPHIWTAFHLDAAVCLVGGVHCPNCRTELGACDVIADQASGHAVLICSRCHRDERCSKSSAEWLPALCQQDRADRAQIGPAHLFPAQAAPPGAQPGFDEFSETTLQRFVKWQID
jgi:hypothetical protein